MYENDDPFAAYELAEHLRDCILPYLEMTTQGVPGRVCIHTGDIAWDDCECGQLVISWVDDFESVNFPAPGDGSQNSGTLKCGAPLFVYQYTVSMLRCAPIGDGENPPTCEEIGAAARITVEDAWAVRTGLKCCMCAGVERDPATGIKRFERFWISPQTAVGPQGACQGTQLNVFIGVKNGGYPCMTS